MCENNVEEDSHDNGEEFELPEVSLFIISAIVRMFFGDAIVDPFDGNLLKEIESVGNFTQVLDWAKVQDRLGSGRGQADKD